MSCTLAQLGDAILAALRALGPPSGALTYVGRARAPITAENPPSFESFGGPSAALVHFQGETPEPVGRVATLARGVTQRVGRSTWVVYVAVAEPRGPDEEIDGTGDTAGLLPLQEQVLAALDGLDVIAPPATLAVAVTGAPNATVGLGAAVLTIGVLRYQPTPASVTLDGSGHGTLNATCVTAGAPGNAPDGTEMAWSPGAPAGLDATAAVASTVTPGASGLYRRSRLEPTGAAQVAAQLGVLSVYALTFTALRVLPKHADVDASSPFVEVRANWNRAGTAHDAGTTPDPSNPLQNPRDVTDDAIPS